MGERGDASVPKGRARRGNLLLLIALGGCAFVDDFDALRAISKPISGKVESTSGSGTIVSPAYELRLNVGHPQPMGVIESPSYRLELGPTAP